MSNASGVRRLIVVCGGPSGEHEVSLNSGANVVEAVGERFEVLPMVWTRDGTVWLGKAAERALAGRSTVDVEAPDEAEVVRDLAAAFALVGVDGDDVVFPALHGPMGEDGAVQGFLEVVGVPYVGSGVRASSTGMDKVAAKHVFAQAGLAVLDWQAVEASSWRHDPEVVLRNLEGWTFPTFVKPARMGSSVGISRVARTSDWRTAFDEAFRHDDVAIVERGLTGHREIEVAVWGGLEPRVSPPGEIVVGSDGFYDYAKKYTDGAVRLEIPADLSPTETERAKRWALRAHLAIGAFGLSRVDLFLDADGRWWLNEINTMPGFTRTSMFPKLVEAAGTGFVDAICEQIELAVKRHRRSRDGRGGDAKVGMSSE